MGRQPPERLQAPLWPVATDRQSGGMTGADNYDPGPEFGSQQLLHAQPHDVAGHAVEPLDARGCLLDMALERPVGEHDDVDLALALARLLLHHRFYRDLAVGEHARNVREHARAVE